MPVHVSMHMYVGGVAAISASDSCDSFSLWVAAYSRGVESVAVAVAETVIKKMQQTAIVGGGCAMVGE